MLKKDVPLTLLTFNLKRDGAFGRKNKWNQRSSLAIQLVQQSNADILGVQELLPHMRKDMEDSLTGYQIIGSGRYEGSKPGNDEHSDLFINKKTAEVCSYRTFWLSKQPQAPGSRGFLALFPRICTMAEVRLLRSGKRVRIFNTHLDCISGFARVLGVKTILNCMESMNREEKLPCILMGDMNAKPGNRAIALLRDHRKEFPEADLFDVYESTVDSPVHNSFHRFNGKIKEGRQPIDYIFVSKEFDTVGYRICTDNFEGKYPSDHFPLMASVRLKG